MIAAVIPQKKIWTEADLQALPDNGYIHEVVNGELVMSPKNNFEHEIIGTRLLVALENFNAAHHLGVVLGSSAGFWMHNRNCRAPDLSFLSKERLKRAGFNPSTAKFFPGAPDLAVEILARSNTPREITERLEDFFNSGTQFAWIIHPGDQFVEVCHSPEQRKIIGSGGFLEGEQLLPGFRFPIADLFAGWNWE